MEYQLKHDAATGLCYQVPIEVDEEEAALAELDTPDEAPFLVPDKVFDIPGLESFNLPAPPTKKTRKKRECNSK
jgi:hypothetical protein